MSLEEIVETLILASVSGAVIGSIIFFLLKHFFSGYLSEKAKNLAKIEDIEKITKKVEEVKLQYVKQIKSLIHQNNLLLEGVRGKHQLRLAALDKRLQAHQEAFELWRKMMSNIRGEERSAIVLECQDWYNKNCLYLEPKARNAFILAYGAMVGHDDKPDYNLVVIAGDAIVKGAELPSFGEQEFKLITEENMPNKSTKGAPKSGAPS